MPSPQMLGAGLRMSLREWGELPEDEPGELVDGQLVEEEEVGFLHDVVVAWLIRTIGNWVATQGGFVGASDTRFAVSQTRGRKPDISAYFAGRRPPPHGLVTLEPDIMVEVVSPRPSDARRDRLEKMSEYAAFGVRYYWIVDPSLRLLEVFELDAQKRYTKVLGAAAGVITAIPGCDGLAMNLDELWSELDRLQADT